VRREHGQCAFVQIGNEAESRVQRQCHETVAKENQSETCGTRREASQIPVTI
jgi:hypothetical protein